MFRLFLFPFQYDQLGWPLELIEMCFFFFQPPTERKLSIQSAAQQTNSDEDGCRSGTPDQDVLVYHVS